MIHVQCAVVFVMYLEERLRDLDIHDSDSSDSEAPSGNDTSPVTTAARRRGRVVCTSVVAYGTNGVDRWRGGRVLRPSWEADSAW